MPKIMDKGLGARVRFSTYGNIGDVNTFEGEIVNIFAGKAHDASTTALAQHANIYPSLPKAVKDITPNDYRQYNFFTILKDDGGQVDIGIPWVNEATVESVVARKCSIVLNNFTDSDGEAVRKILTQNNLEVESIIISSN